MNLKEICKLFCHWHDIDLTPNLLSTGSETLSGRNSNLIVLYKTDSTEERLRIKKGVEIGSQKLTESYIRISSVTPAELVFDETLVRIINGAIPDYLALLDKTENSDFGNMSSLVPFVKDTFSKHYINSTTPGRVFFPNKAHQETYDVMAYYEIIIFLDSIYPSKVPIKIK